mgnify:CR=1 FL=1
MKMKKILITGAVILLILMGAGIVYVWNEQEEPPVKVDPKDKVVLSDQALLSRRKNPSLHFDVELAKSDEASAKKGYILKGKIVKEEELWTPYVPSAGGNFEEVFGEGLGISSILYTIDLDEVWYGEPEGDEFILQIGGDRESMITKPNMGDEVIVFAFQREGMPYPQLVDMEHSLFTDNNRLYSFSNTEELSSYDGKKASELKRDVERIMKELGM